MRGRAKLERKKLKKPERIDMKVLFKPSVAITVLLIMVLCFVAVKMIADGIVLNREKERLSGGTSVLRSDSYIINSEEDIEITDMGTLSKKLSALKSTHKEWTNYAEDPSQNGFFCIATEVYDRRLVYNIDQHNICDMGYSLDDFEYLWVDSVNDGFYAVVNIGGETVDLSDYYILVRNDSGNLASRLVINCYEAKVVDLRNTIFMGTLLAPNASVTYDSTSVYGQVYAKSSSGNRAFYKEIAFGGYSQVMTEVYDVTFQNPTIRSNVLSWLKKTYPSVYANYPEDYQLNSLDLSYVNELVLDGMPILDLYDDLKLFTKLESLSVRNTKLTEIDLTKAPAVEKLDVSGSTVGSIIIDKENNLKSLTADNTVNLVSLDAAYFGSLEELRVSERDFAGLIDLTALPSLKSLDLSRSNFTGFDSEVLAGLSNLTYIDISNNKTLTSFDITPFTNLEYLDISQCSLDKLDLTGATVLKELHCGYNNITSLDLTPAKSLTVCSAYGQSMKYINAKGLAVRINCFNGVEIET